MLQRAVQYDGLDRFGTGNCPRMAQVRIERTGNRRIAVAKKAISGVKG
jgi:hypothetical protein